MRLDELFKDIEDKYEPENITEGYEELPSLSELRRDKTQDRPQVREGSDGIIFH